MIQKLDTHVHMMPHTKSRVDWEQVRLYPQVARVRGLDGFCLTEHRHAAHFEELLEGVFGGGRLEGELIGEGVFRCGNGILIFCGAEVAIAGGGDVGVHAPPGVIAALSSAKGAYNVLELIRVVEGAGAPSWLAAHHVFSEGKWFANLEEAAGRLDAIEFPSKGVARREEYLALAARLGKPTVSSSDAHTWVQVGAGQTPLEAPESGLASIQAVKEAVAASREEPVFHASLAELVALNKIYRQHLEPEL